MSEARSMRGLHLPLSILIFAGYTLGCVSTRPGRPSELPGAPPGDVYGDPLPPGAMARLGTLRFRHSGPVTCIAYSTDGSRLASGCTDGSISIWHATTGRRVQTLPGHEDGVRDIAFSPDGETLASVGAEGGLLADGDLLLWDVPAGRIRKRLVGFGFVVFSPKGDTLLTGAESGEVYLLEVADGEERFRWPSSPWYKGWRSTFSPDGRLVVSGDRIWDTETGAEMGRIGEDAPVLEFSPDGKTIATIPGGAIWDAESGESLGSFRADGVGPGYVTYGPGGGVLAGGLGLECASGTGFIYFWEVPGGKVRRKIYGHDGPILCAAFSPDGETLASGGEEGAIHLWDVETGMDVTPVVGHTVGAPEMSISADGLTLVSTGADGAARVSVSMGDDRIRLWDLPTGRPVAVWESRDRATFSSDGRYLLLHDPRDGVGTIIFDDDDDEDELLLAGPSERRLTEVLDLNEGEPVAPWESDEDLHERVLEVFSAPACEAGSTLILDTAGEGPDYSDDPTTFEIRIWDLASKESVFHLKEARAGPYVSSDGRFVAAGLDDGKVHVWDVLGQEELAPLDGELGRHTFFARGRKLLTTSPGPDGGLLVRDVDSGALRLRAEGVERHYVFSHDNGRMATRPTPSSGDPKSVLVFDVWTGDLIVALQPHRGIPTRFEFSPDGESLLVLRNVQAIRSSWGGTGTLTFDDDDDDEEPDGAEDPKKADGDVPSAPAVREDPPDTSYISLWDIRNGRRLLSIPGTGEWNVVRVFSTDGSRLAIALEDGRVQVHETLTGRVLRTLPRIDLPALELAFSPDGTILAASTTDGAILAWDVEAIDAGERSARSLQESWSDLGGTDPRRVRDAYRSLIQSGNATVSFLQDLLLSASPQVSERTRQLVADLDHDDYSVREAAQRSLREMAGEAETALLRGSGPSSSAELRRRVGKLLEPYRRPRRFAAGERARVLRGIWALETIGTDEARDLLDGLVRSLPWAIETAEAEAAVGRLERRESR